MEIKTCEQYVLAKVHELEEENSNLKENIESLEMDYHVLHEEYRELKRILTKYMKLRSLQNHNSDSRYITFNDIDEWQNDETREDLITLVGLLNLVNLDEEEDDASISDKV